MVSRLFVANPRDVVEIARALDSAVRIQMLETLADEPMSINRLAERMGIPQSTCSTNISILAKARLVRTESVPAAKGSKKICHVDYDEVLLPLFGVPRPAANEPIVTEMPIGLFTSFEVSPPCGLINESHVVGFYDDRNSFLDPRRAGVQLLWFSEGYIEYSFPRNVPTGKRVRTISISAELCSEFPGYRNDWPSDIMLSINGVSVGVWTSPGDMGGRRGKLTPPWWSLHDTQFGFLTTWQVSDAGSFLNGVRVSDTTLSDLKVGDSNHILVRFSLPGSDEHRGGMNLFGSKCGDYPQDIMLKLEVEQDEPVIIENN